VTNRSPSFLGTWITPGNAADLRNQTDALGKLRRAGVLLGAGSDFERPDGMQYELEALVEASRTPLEAIAAATGNAARIMGAQADIGRIAPGLLADIVLLDADPTVDIRNARRVWAVIQGGRVLDRQALARPG
jgi:imidazolonepropionase-like amidohydrolase